MSESTDAAQAAAELLEAVKMISQTQSDIAKSQLAMAKTQQTVAEAQKTFAESQKSLTDALRTAIATQNLKAEVLSALKTGPSQGIEKDAKGVVTDEGFPNFKYLPPEIREEIWKMALPPPQIYEPYYNGSMDKMRFKFPSRPPPMRGACKEAWAVTEAAGVFALDYSWFNPDRDIIFLSDDSPDTLDMSYETVMYDVPQARHVAVDWVAVSRRLSGQSPRGVLEHLSHCETVIMAVRITCLHSGRFPHFFALRDHDPVEWREPWHLREHVYQTWEDVKHEVMGMWAQYASEKGIALNKLPKLEGFEVLWKHRSFGDASLRVDREDEDYCD